MYKYFRFIFPFIVIIPLVSFWGCKESTEPSNIDAYAALEEQMFILTSGSIDSPTDLTRANFAEVNTQYKKDVAANPSNAAANFGAGFTEIMMVNADPAVGAMIQQWSSVDLGKNPASSLFRFGIPSGTGDMSVPLQPLAQNLTKIIQTAATNPPLISEMQALLRDHLLPRIDYALARFAVVELDPTFEFKISGKMQGDQNLQAVYLDNTEVFIMDGVLRGMKAMIEQFLVYKFNLTAYTTPAIVEALQPANTEFFYRATDGVARSQSVLADITSMIGKFESAINYLKTETDDQSDDIIKIAQPGVSGVSGAILDTTLVYLGKAADAFTSTQTITYNDGDTTYIIQVNLGNFYNNPPQNPKTAWFPLYTVDTTTSGGIALHWIQQDYASLAFPDPTFNGLFPGMTNDVLKRILHLDRLFDI